MRPVLVFVVLFPAFLLAACGRGASLGADEAVEILVLDGVERRQAECVIADLDGELDLEKITGLDARLDDTDVAMLSTASAACAPVVTEGGGVTAGEEVLEDMLESDVQLEIEIGVERLVGGLVRGGLSPEVAACIGAAVESASDPLISVEDERFLAATLLVCDPG